MTVRINIASTLHYWSFEIAEIYFDNLQAWISKVIPSNQTYLWFLVGC